MCVYIWHQRSHVRNQKIGNIFSGLGVFYVTIQYFLLTGFVKRFVFYKIMQIVEFFSVPLCCMIPLSLITNRLAPEEDALTLSSLLLPSIIYVTISIFSLFVFSTLNMTINRTVLVHQRGTMHGLCMLGSLVVKSLGPASVGIFFSSSVEHFTPPSGSVVVFACYSCVGLYLAMCALLLQEPEQSDEVATIKSPSSCDTKLKYDDNSKDDKAPSF